MILNLRSRTVSAQSLDVVLFHVKERFYKYERSCFGCCEAPGEQTHVSSVHYIQNRFCTWICVRE